MNQKWLFIGALVAVLLAAGCSPSPTASPTSTLGTTELPAPTATPRPTATSAPPAATSTSQLGGHDQAAFEGLLVFADWLYQGGGYANAIIVYSEMLSLPMGRFDEAYVYTQRADTYDRVGEFEMAIADYAHAVELGPQPPAVLNNLCWDYGITGQPQNALVYCEQAVQGEPSAAHRDSRGLVYAQLGMFEEAIADFEAVVAELRDTGDPALSAISDDRQGWLDTLQLGVNPITAEVLTVLQEETRATTLEPPSKETYAPVTRARTLAGAEEQGFAFGEVTEADGQESVTGVTSQGACNATIVLTGPAEAIDTATLRLTGCDDATQSGWGMAFMGLLLAEDPEVQRAMLEDPDIARAMVWLSTDLYYLIEGHTDTAGPKQIGDVTFTALRFAEPEPALELNAVIRGPGG